MPLAVGAGTVAGAVNGIAAGVAVDQGLKALGVSREMRIVSSSLASAVAHGLTAVYMAPVDAFGAAMAPFTASAHFVGSVMGRIAKAEVTENWNLPAE